MAVESSHFLVRLLQSITVPQSQNIERYYDNVDAISLNVSMALKMTSAISKGEMFDGVFYGKGNPEILIAHNVYLPSTHVRIKGACIDRKTSNGV